MSVEAVPPMTASSFIPNSDYSRAFRNALGQFGTGVAIVTTTTERGNVGITANSFASVSLDPPLVLWSPAKSSKRYDAFTQAQRYAIHLLAHEQRHICHMFVKNGDRFDDLLWNMSENNVPLIEQCLAIFECQQHAVHDAGDHAIVVGRVERTTLNKGNPLLFFGGAYGEFNPSG